MTSFRGAGWLEKMSIGPITSFIGGATTSGEDNPRRGVGGFAVGRGIREKRLSVGNF